MGGKFYKSDEFQGLQKEWTKKLRDEGFIDIEFMFPDGNTSHLVKPALGVGAWPVDYKKARANSYYYSMASKFLWDFSFKKPRHKHVWRLHSLGMSLRQIERHTPGEHNAHRTLQNLLPHFFEYIKAMQEFEDNGA